MELISLDIPLLLILNQVDRARLMGLKLDPVYLSRELGVPVILFSANTGEGCCPFGAVGKGVAPHKIPLYLE
jgi:ferrous iron transport protein B